jgi:hypothetical protein
MSLHDCGIVATRYLNRRVSECVLLLPPSFLLEPEFSRHQPHLMLVLAARIFTCQGPPGSNVIGIA